MKSTHRKFEHEHCELSCPFLEQWDHPFWNRTAWCWHQMRGLTWHDSWLADCTFREPDEHLRKNYNYKYIEVCMEKGLSDD